MRVLQVAIGHRATRIGAQARQRKHRDADECSALESARILEVPMPYRRRLGGGSKVAGTLRAAAMRSE
jgi:hypothetical protein